MRFARQKWAKSGLGIEILQIKKSPHTQAGLHFVWLGILPAGYLFYPFSEYTVA